MSEDGGVPKRDGNPDLGRAVCELHGLAVGDDRGCVICRRVEGNDRSWGGTVQLAILAAVALAVFAVVRNMMREGSEPTAVVAVGASPDGTPLGAAPTVAPRTPITVKPTAQRRRAPAHMPRKIASHAPTPVAGTVGGKAGQPSDAAIEAEMHRVPITMYGTQWCPYCAKARAWLGANGYRYAELDVDADESAKRTRDELVPRGGVPVFTVGGAVVNGFSAGSMQRALRRAAERRLASR